MIPVDSGGSGLSDTSYDDFVQQVEDLLQKVHDAIQQGIDYVKSQWDGSLLSSWVKYTSPGLWAAAKYAEHKLEDAFNALWDKFEELEPKIWEQVRRLFATPGALMQLSSAYAQAAGSLRDEGTLVDRAVRYVGEGWEGDAFSSYSGMANEQKLALLGLQTDLTTASTSCAAGAKQIFDTWHTIIKAALDYASSIVSAIKDGTDGGQIVTCDVGPAIKVIGDIAIRTLQLADDLAKFWTDNGTVNLAVWNNLNSGTSGLGAGNHWPNAAPFDDHNIKTKGDWAHAS